MKRSVKCACSLMKSPTTLSRGVAQKEEPPVMLLHHANYPSGGGAVQVESA
jgi:hypothetical protein